MKKLLVALPLLGLLSTVTACSVPLKAKVPVERPPLDVPPPPPRVVEPAPVPDDSPQPVPDLPPPPAPARPAKPTQPRPNNNSTPAEAKPEPKPDQAPPTDSTATPATTTPAAPAVPQLRTPQTADGSEAEKTVRATLDRAKTVLGGVNFNPLSNERKKAYNDAKAFIQQAEDALKQGNYVFAQGVATKAETLAHELAGR
jgi:outer membrane biosynthesis protein TonB